MDEYGGGAVSASGGGGRVVVEGDAGRGPEVLVDEESCGCNSDFEDAPRLVMEGCTTDGMRLRKVALPTPGEPRKRMSI